MKSFTKSSPFGGYMPFRCIWGVLRAHFENLEHWEPKPKRKKILGMTHDSILLGPHSSPSLTL